MAIGVGRPEDAGGVSGKIEAGAKGHEGKESEGRDHDLENAFQAAGRFYIFNAFMAKVQGGASFLLAAEFNHSMVDPFEEGISNHGESCGHAIAVNVLPKI